MKTSKIINMLTAAITGLNEANDLATHVELVDGKIMHTEGEMWSAAHTLQSQPAELVRELWDELPESLRTDEGEELIAKLYPHKYELDGYKSMTPIIRDLHTLIYDLWQQMSEAKDKFGLK